MNILWSQKLTLSLWLKYLISIKAAEEARGAWNPSVLYLMHIRDNQNDSACGWEQSDILNPDQKICLLDPEWSQTDF